MTKIPYCEETWAVTAGCTKCSPGCENCWAEKWALRLAGIEYSKYGENMTAAEGKYTYVTDHIGKWNGEIYLDESILDKPLQWRKPRRIFVNSMSDLFHPKVPFEFQCNVFDIIRRTPRHTYLVFTKRIDKILKIYQENPNKDWPIAPNLQLILSLSTQKEADEKIPILLQIPAAVRGLSLEPLLESVDLKFFKGHDVKQNSVTTGKPCIANLDTGMMIDWIIVGCESGSKRRPCKAEWVYSIVHQCQAANVPVYVKQLPLNGKVVRRNKDGSWPNEWPEDLRIQQYP